MGEGEGSKLGNRQGKGLLCDGLGWGEGDGWMNGWVGEQLGNGGEGWAMGRVTVKDDAER